jgi:hypothetical protein
VQQVLYREPLMSMSVSMERLIQCQAIDNYSDDQGQQ